MSLLNLVVQVLRHAVGSGIVCGLEQWQCSSGDNHYKDAVLLPY